MTGPYKSFILLSPREVIAFLDELKFIEGSSRNKKLSAFYQKFEARMQAAPTNVQYVIVAADACKTESPLGLPMTREYADRIEEFYFSVERLEIIYQALVQQHGGADAENAMLWILKTVVDYGQSVWTDLDRFYSRRLRETKD